LEKQLLQLLAIHFNDSDYAVDDYPKIACSLDRKVQTACFKQFGRNCSD